MFIDHRICWTDDEILDRLAYDSMLVERLIKEGRPVKARIAYHSEATGETHTLPVFHTDSMTDVLNRYMDFFPREMELVAEETANISQTLHSSDAMNNSRTLMASLRIPIGLWKLLDSWKEGFWETVPGKNAFKNKKLINQLTSLIPKLRIKPQGVRVHVVN